MMMYCALDVATDTATCISETGDPAHITYTDSSKKIGDMDNWVCQDPKQWKTTMDFCGVQVYGAKP